MNSPRSISVVLAVYNATWCIERALDSVLAQTRPVREVLVCDDGSTDGTADLVERKYGARVTVLRLPHKNAAATRTVGLERAEGDWLAFLDADDMWEPEKIERQNAFLDAHPDVRWLTSDGRYVSDEGVLRESWMADYFDPVRELSGDLFRALVLRCFPLVSSMLVDRECYRAVGGLDPGIPRSYDYDLWLRLAARYPGGLQPEKLVRYWWHPGQLSRNIEARYLEDLAIMERVAAGELRREPDVIRLAGERVASHRFDLGLWALRAGKDDEARRYFRGAVSAGPASRRAMALAAALAPPPLLRAVMRSAWLKRSVQGARATVAPIEPGREKMT